MFPFFKKIKLLLISFFLLCLLPSFLQAHMIKSGVGGFIAGFEHPLLGLDHFLAMFSVGLWGAQIGGRSVWTLPVTFPLIMVIGGFLGLIGISLPGIEVGIALSILVLGLAISVKWKPSEKFVLFLISFFAICHGYAHGIELPNALDPADFALGFVVATGFIHVIGIGVGLVSQKQFEGKLTQILGTFVSLGGIYFLIMAL